MRFSKTTISLLALAGGMFVSAIAARNPSTYPASEPPPVIHREQPDDPPGQAAKDDPFARSRAAPVLRGPFVSIQVNLDEFGNNIVGDAANEPSIAIDPNDPNKIAIGWRQFDTIASNFRQGGWAYSQDAGQTWTFPGVLEPGQFRSDPVLASDADGNFYYSSLSALDSAQVFKSTDGGVTWPTMADAFGGDKQWIAVDRTSGIGSGNIYQIWNVQFSCCPPNDFTRSTNGGALFESPITVPTPSMKWGTMDVGPDGTLYLAGAALSTSNGHLFTKSANAQNPAQMPTFAATQSINLGGRTDFTNPPNPAGLLGQVWIATDHSDGSTRGNIYILASVDPPGGDPLDVMFIRSTDDGQTWSSPTRVNDDPTDNGAWQWFGTMSVAPNGRIDVVWNDTRNTGADNLSELFYSFSTDGGLTWADNMPISPIFDSHLGWPNQNKIGDYYGMISDSFGSNLAYAATFNGEQDVYFLRIDLNDCNNNGIDDDQDIADGTSADCNGNGVPDECEDCNENGQADSCDIADGTSEDCNGNGLPDECEADCNGNGVADSCDISDATSQDCNGNGVPDECEPDCNENGQADNCDIADTTSQDCNGNAVPDECEPDCNENGVADSCDIAEGTSEDCTGNGQPDECEPDCNTNGQADSCDVAVVFFEQIITTAANGADSVFAADLDGDGDNDVLSASFNDDKIAWYENTDGLGSFGPQQVISTAANGAQSVFAADLDGDGDNDVLSASFFDGKIAWYENTDGLGSFGAQQIISTFANGPWSVFAADLDGDGDIDVLSASINDDRIAWYENTDGLGSFVPRQINTTAADSARSVFAADLDGDGDNDVLSASFNDDKIAWYENIDGLGSFGPQQIITTFANGAAFVFAADLDGDGDNDVLSASEFDDKIAWYENTDGLGSFGPQQIITTAADRAHSVFAADLDGDGDNDVLSASQNDDKIAWYENIDGLGSFGPQQIITTAANGAQFALAVDLDGDGVTDVLSASRFDDKIAWYANLSDDCNGNDIPDACDIADGSADCNGNAVPDECESDCNENGQADSCDIANGTSEDCNGNDVPDECDIAEGASEDCNGNGVPDDCIDLEDDCNANDIPDECEEGIHPVITTQPQDQEVTLGALATFSVSAEGLVLAYQWRKDGVDLSNTGGIFGSHSALLGIFDVAKDDSGLYDCVVTALLNNCSTTTESVVLTVIAARPLDIKPGSCPNPFNRGSNGVLPVALPGTEKFDAAGVDLSTLQLSRADGVGGSVAPNEGPPGPHSVLEDVATPFDGEGCACHELVGDGIDDLSMKFRTRDLVDALELDDLSGGAVVELVLRGSLLDGTPFVASDCIVIVPPGDLAPANAFVGSNVTDTFVAITPIDLNFDGDGFADFARSYYSGTVLTLTAPLRSVGRRFVRWSVDGVLQDVGLRTLDLVVDQDISLRAVYERRRRSRPDRPMEDGGSVE